MGLHWNWGKCCGAGGWMRFLGLLYDRRIPPKNGDLGIKTGKKGVIFLT